MRSRKKRKQPAGGGARSDGAPARAPPSEGAAVAAAPAFDPQAARDKIRAEHAKYAKNYRDAGAENCTWTMDAPDLQKELKAYSAWALAKYPAPGAPLHPVKIAEYVKEVYGKNITDGKWKYSTAQQHLVKMGFIWRHMLASDPATRAVQNTVCPPYPQALGAIPCVKQAMSLAASAGARVHAARPIIATIETRMRRGDMLAILDSMRSMTPTMPHLAMEANLALSAMLGYRGNNMRALRAVHLLVDTIEVGESETYAALCTTVRQAKKFSSTGNAEDRRGGALRHRDIALCGIGRLALLWMFHAVSDEDSGLRFDDFNDLPKLRERPAFASSYSKKEGYSQPSSGVTTVAITTAKKRCGRESTDKATHLGRLAFAKKAKAYDAARAKRKAEKPVVTLRRRPSWRRGCMVLTSWAARSRSSTATTTATSTFARASPPPTRMTPRAMTQTAMERVRSTSFSRFTTASNRSRCHSSRRKTRRWSACVARVSGRRARSPRCATHRLRQPSARSRAAS